MKINTDINILGGLPDINLVNHFWSRIPSLMFQEPHHTYSSIKTEKSVKRFEKAITKSLLKFENIDIENLFSTSIETEVISSDSLLLFFWNVSYNNELLNYLNQNVYFIAFYSGRISIKQSEVFGCLKDLREREPELKQWSDSTLSVTASKYLTLLKKFHLMEGSLNKTILHPFLNDKLFVLFVYWICAIENKPNILDSVWLQYAFCDKSLFIERITQKKFSKYFNFHYTGDRLKIDTLLSYNNIYHAIK